MELFRFDPPDLTDSDVREIADDLYGITGERRRLRGERSHNTRISLADGRTYVLRVHSANEPAAAIEFHARALVHVADRAPRLPVARMVPSRAGELVPRVERDGTAHLVRLETFLDGTTFDDDQPIRRGSLERVGELLGGVASALADLSDPAADGFMPWDIANGLAHDAQLRQGLTAVELRLVERADPWLQRAGAALVSLPRQVIHNDGHAGNLLRRDATSDEVCGLIDFGDLVRTVTAADLGVAGASLVPHQHDPLAAIAALTAGYHRRHPLAIGEREAVVDLVATRLVLSTVLCRYQIENSPHIAGDVAVEQAGIVAKLERWLELDPSEVASAIERAIDHDHSSSKESA